jgi:hypothetical protein
LFSNRARLRFANQLQYAASTSCRSIGFTPSAAENRDKIAPKVSVTFPDEATWSGVLIVAHQFVADCAKAAGVDGIVYPSCRLSYGDNIVLLEPLTWKRALKPVRIREFNPRLDRSKSRR